MRSFPQAAIPVAREALPISDMQRGLGGMNQPNVGLNNADDGGAMSKPYANQQPQLAQQLAVQQMSQNRTTAAPQYAADAMGQVRAAAADKSTADYRAQEFLTTKLDQELERSGNDKALMTLAAVTQSPEKQKFLTSIAESKAQFAGQAPELGAYAAETQQYSMG